MYKKIFAIVKKDFLIETSYKISFIFNLFSVVVTLFTYFFIDKLFGHKVNDYLQEFGVNYFSYVLISMAFFSYIGVGLGSFASRIRAEQIQGTLESLIITPTKINTILLGMGLWNFIIASFDLFIYIILGIFMFKIDFSNVNLLSTTLTLMLTVISFSSLGIISASFILIFKRGNPIAWIINTLEGLLGGVYFPITVMPDWLQICANFLPITHAIRAIQLSVYKNFGIIELKNELLILLIFSITLFPLSSYIFNAALKKTRIQGTLSQY